MERYFTDLATAFVRGRLGDDSADIVAGEASGLRLHKFKRDGELPRVQYVIGILRGLAPTRLLDIGSGRGTFLWPLLSAFPDLDVTAVDLSERRVKDINAVRIGGISRVAAVQMEAQKMAFARKSFDVVTMLEVLEHLPDPAAALSQAIEVARRFVLISVPSVPDDNPEHIHLFSRARVEQMAKGAGAHRVTIEHVLNHRIAILRVLE